MLLRRVMLRVVEGRLRGSRIRGGGRRQLVPVGARVTADLEVRRVMVVQRAMAVGRVMEGPRAMVVAVFGVVVVV